MSEIRLRPVVRLCRRCGFPMHRKVMATAKYCSSKCRQESARVAYLMRQGKIRPKRRKPRLILQRFCGRY